MTTATLDPLSQFSVKSLVPLSLGGVDFSLTNASGFMLMGVVLLTCFFIYAFRKPQLLPSAWQTLAEMPLSFVKGLLKDSVGPEGNPFLSLIASIFLFVFAGNALGMMPFSFTFTSQIIINFSLAFLILVLITFIGFFRHGTHFLRLFCPEGLPWWVAPILIPIELISYLSRPVSLAIRLFANMVAGHSMLKIFAYFTTTLGIFGVIPLAVNMGLIAFECMVCFLQAYVFTMLCCIYLNDAIHLH